jgi:hypothetical protein
MTHAAATALRDKTILKRTHGLDRLTDVLLADALNKWRTAVIRKAPPGDTAAFAGEI